VPLLIDIFLCRTDNYGYLVHDVESGKTAAIDAPDAKAIKAALGKRGWRLSDVFITHHHTDHVEGIPVLKRDLGVTVTGPEGEQSKILGLDVLVKPGDTAPPVVGSALMALAGAAWGVYSLRGRGAKDPIAATAGNFLYASPLAVLAALALWNELHITPRGLVLAVASGAITSGLGYVIWYRALPGLTATRAALVQLAVPILTAFAAIVLLNEELPPRLVLSAGLVLGGIALAVWAKK